MARYNASPAATFRPVIQLVPEAIRAPLSRTVPFQTNGELLHNVMIEPFWSVGQIGQELHGRAFDLEEVPLRHPRQENGLDVLQHQVRWHDRDIFSATGGRSATLSLRPKSAANSSISPSWGVRRGTTSGSPR